MHVVLWCLWVDAGYSNVFGIAGGLSEFWSTNWSTNDVYSSLKLDSKARACRWGPLQTRGKLRPQQAYNVNHFWPVWAHHAAAELYHKRLPPCVLQLSFDKCPAFCRASFTLVISLFTDDITAADAPSGKRLEWLAPMSEVVLVVHRDNMYFQILKTIEANQIPSHLCSAFPMNVEFSAVPRQSRGPSRLPRLLRFTGIQHRYTQNPTEMAALAALIWPFVTPSLLTSWSSLGICFSTWLIWEVGASKTELLEGSIVVYRYKTSNSIVRCWELNTLHLRSILYLWELYHTPTTQHALTFNHEITSFTACSIASTSCNRRPPKKLSISISVQTPNINLHSHFLPSQSPEHLWPLASNTNFAP